MKNRKIWIILTVVILCLALFAGCKAEETPGKAPEQAAPSQTVEPTKPATSDPAETKEEAKQDTLLPEAQASEAQEHEDVITGAYTVEDIKDVDKTYFVNSAGKKLALAYYKSMETIDGNNVRIYRDNDHNEYTYNHNNEFVRFATSEKMRSTKNETLSVEELTKIARAHLEEYYGKEYMAPMKFKECVGYEEGTGADTCSITFAVEYQKGIYGESCMVRICKNGSIASSTTFGKGSLKDFNADLLNNISQKQIDAAAKKETEKYGDSVDNYKIDTLNVSKTDAGKYELTVVVDVVVKRDGDLYSNTEHTTIPLQ